MLIRTLPRPSTNLISVKPTRIRTISTPTPSPTSPTPQDYTDRFSLKLHQRIFKAAAFGHLSRTPTDPLASGHDSRYTTGSTEKGKGKEVVRDGTNDYVSSYVDQGYRTTKSRGWNKSRVELQGDRTGGAGSFAGSSGGKLRNDTRSRRAGLTKSLPGSREMSTTAFTEYQGQAMSRSRGAPILNSWKREVEVIQSDVGKGRKGKGMERESETSESVKKEVRMVNSSELEVGYWVETRVKGFSTSGINLGPSPLDSAFSYMLTSSGLGVYRPSDITFILPHFTSPPRGLLALEKGIDSPECHTLVQELRSFDTRIEGIRAELVGMGALDLYRSISASNATKPDERYTVTTSQAYLLLTSKPATSLESLLALHQILLESPLHFTADAVSHRTSHTFTVRPMSDLNRYHLVRTWVRERSVEMLGFAQRARAIRAWGKEQIQSITNNTTTTRISTTSGEPLPHLKLPISLDWESSDLEILNFLRRSLENQRLIQLQPYLSIAPSLLKIVEEGERNSNLGKVEIEVLDTRHLAKEKKVRKEEGKVEEEFDRERIMSFLVEVGAVQPWENWATLSPEAGLQARQNEGEEITRRNSLNLKSGSPPGRSGELDPHEKVRFDFGALKVYTVDDIGAKELDDGISIERCPDSNSTYWIHVHIADPTSILSPTHEISRLARKRFQTIYLPEGTWGMLPSFFLERNGLSLGSKSDNFAAGEGGGKGQRVLSLSTKINDAGEVLESRIRAGVVNDVKRLTYGAVDRVLGVEGGTGGKSTVLRIGPTVTSSSEIDSRRETDDSTLATDVSSQEDLKLLHRLASTLLRVRSEKSLFWNFPSASISVTPSLSPTFDTLYTPTFYSRSPTVLMKLPPTSSDSKIPPAQILVSELMILANRTAARFCVERGIPVPFRTQSPPNASPEAIEAVLALRDPTNGSVRGEEVLKYNIDFDPARSKVTTGQHWPMGIQDDFGYLKVTSPLRRYSDMFCHWQIKAALLPKGEKGAKVPFGMEESKVIVKEFDRVERAQKPLEKAGNAFWSHYLLREKLLVLNSPSSQLNSPSSALETDRMVLDNLTALALRKPTFSLTAGHWTQRVLLLELGIRAQIVMEGITQAPEVGMSVPVRIERITISENPRCIVVMK